MSNLLDVFDGNEIFVYVADEYTSNELTGESESFTGVSTDDTVTLAYENVTVTDVTESTTSIAYTVDGNDVTITESGLTGVEITVTYDATEISFNWERIDFRRNVSPDIPDTARDVYDAIRLKGTKPQRAEGISLSVEAEFQGFKRGLWKYENTSGLLAKIEIEPHGDYNQEDLEMWGNVSYYLNWNPENANFSPADEGEVTVTLEGAFDERVYDTPTVAKIQEWMTESV